jgi:cytochrome b subunit of formate dehydrogenase
MTTLLVGTLTFALLHTFAWLIRLWLTRKEWKRHKPQPGKKMYRRFDRAQRTMHLVMLLSFFVLAITGMCLKFSYATWAQWLAELVGGFDTTGVLHRIAAVLLFGIFFTHLWDVKRRRAERKLSWKETLFGPGSMMFSLRDLKEVWGSIKWFLGFGPRPQYGRYTYWEKFDYFAVFWGVAIIGSTGLVLWFPEFFTRLLPGWSVNVATIIHSDEALLAVGFIFTIHFFNTHFRPDKFPMDPVIFTGRVPLEELKHDKPDEYRMLVESGELEKKLVERLPEGVERGFRIFGILALVVGLTLIGLIIYAMLAGYQ